MADLSARIRGAMSEQDQWTADGVPDCGVCGQYGHTTWACRYDEGFARGVADARAAHPMSDRWCDVEGYVSGYLQTGAA